MLLCGYELVVAGYVLIGAQCQNSGQWGVHPDTHEIKCIPKKQADKATVVQYSPCAEQSAPRYRGRKDRAA